MKNNLLSFCLIIFTSLIFGQNTIAQDRAAGGSADGNCIIQPAPESFKRNNGEGTCGINGQIRLSFNQNPTSAPDLVGLFYQDGTAISYITLPVSGDVADLAHHGYISYCLPGGNINPSKKIIGVFRYPGGCQDDAIVYEK